MERPVTGEIKLSFKDQLVFRIIHEQILIQGVPPTNREIQAELELAKNELPKDILDSESIGSSSTSVIDLSLKNLQKAGLIEKARYKNRGIKVLKESILPPIFRYTVPKK